MITLGDENGLGPTKKEHEKIKQIWKAYREWKIPREA